MNEARLIGAPLFLIRALGSLDAAAVLWDATYWTEEAQGERSDGSDEVSWFFQDEDGRGWFHRKQEKWLERFPHLTRRTLERILSELRDDGWLLTRNRPGGFQRLTLFRADLQRIDALGRETRVKPESAKMAAPMPPKWRDRVSVEQVEAPEGSFPTETAIRQNGGSDAAILAGSPTLERSTEERSTEERDPFPATSSTVAAPREGIVERPVLITPTLEGPFRGSSKNIRQKAPKAAAEPALTTPLYEAWAEAVERRHGFIPTRGAITNRQLRDVLKEAPEADAIEVVRFYVERIHDERAVKSRHSLQQLLWTWNAVYGAWKTGRELTKQEAARTQIAGQNQAVLQEFLALERAKGGRP
jgi:hypothetical protein